MTTFTKYKVGLHNVGSYQVAGKPYVTGGLNPAAGELIQIDFPSVTNWIPTPQRIPSHYGVDKLGSKIQ